MLVWNTALVQSQKGDKPLSPLASCSVHFGFLHLISPYHFSSSYLTPGLLITEHIANDQYSGPVSMKNEQLKLHKQLHQL